MYQIVQSFATFKEMQDAMALIGSNATGQLASIAESPSPAGAAAANGAADKRGPGRPPKAVTPAPAAAPKQTHTRSEVNAAFEEYKTRVGVPEAKSLVASLGFVKLADFSEEVLDKAYEAVRAALAAADGSATMENDNDI